eukprot:TRINITY_DN13383_c0_g1_i9.p1 TRINITY_DN13383_c0_g1~~TRINITY_DN13383_c0_g1_i9.p1  ORF type:complete len:501 (+),score=153.03 TRINITY_DN13383_c0_g1_i9:30-1532(+)
MDWKNRIDNIVDRVKFQLHARGIDSLEQLKQFIVQFDHDNSGYFDYAEFNKLLSKMGIFLTSQELTVVFREFDINQDGRINLAEFIQKIRSSISDRRIEIVKEAWNFLDIERRGRLAIADLERIYKAESHPRVRTRAKTAQQIRDEFSSGIRSRSRDGVTVTQNEFLEYHMDVNASLPPEKEAYFIDLVAGTWGLSSSAGYVTPDRLLFLENLLYEKIRQRTVGNDDEGKTVKKAFKYFDLEDKGVVTLPQFEAALINFGCVFTKAEVIALFGKFDRDGTGRLVFDEFASVFALRGSGNNPNVNPVFQATRSPPTDVLGRILGELLKRGDYGVRGISKLFKRADKNRNGKLDRTEFAWVLRENGHQLTKAEQDKLFRYFDKNADDQVTYNEFLRAIRGELNQPRREVVRRAFAKLDTAGKGRITLEDVRQVYDASKHREVISGRKRPDDILREFLGQWDTKDRDGIVTIDEFEDFYADISATIDNDDHFIQLIRNAWRLE